MSKRACFGVGTRAHCLFARHSANSASSISSVPNSQGICTSLQAQHPALDSGNNHGNSAPQTENATDLAKAPKWGAFRQNADGEEKDESQDKLADKSTWGAMKSSGEVEYDQFQIHTAVAPSIRKLDRSMQYRQAPVLDDPRYRPQRPGMPLVQSMQKYSADNSRSRYQEYESTNGRRSGLAANRDTRPARSTIYRRLVFEERPKADEEESSSRNKTLVASTKQWGNHLRPRATASGHIINEREEVGAKRSGADEVTKEINASSEHIPSKPIPEFTTDSVGFQGDNHSNLAASLVGETIATPFKDDATRIEAHATPAPTIDPTIDAEDLLKMRRRAERFKSLEGSEDQSLPKVKRTFHPHQNSRRDVGEIRPGRGLHRIRARRSNNYDEDDDDDSFGEPNSSSMKPARRSKKLRNALARSSHSEYVDHVGSEQAQVRRRKRDLKEQKHQARAALTKAAKISKPVPIEIPPFLSIQNLAALLKVRPEDFIHKVEELGFKNVSMDHVINAENAGLIAMEYNYEPIIPSDHNQDLKPREKTADESNLHQRPPIVTIMGHVDHGKTTLLDYLRHSAVAASEHGGITQHIGAFSVPLQSHGNRLITFLDTPGHAAFLNMRQRGANVTDIVVLVVAADDSVKPQTVEAIKHAKAAGVQIVVAITKVDKEEADLQKVKQDLMVHEVEVEDFGGDIQAVETSGKTGQGVAALEEAILALADVLDVRAEIDGSVEGWILEAASKRAGRAATVLVRRGTLRPGNILVAGKTWARARALRNEVGIAIAEVPPGTPVEVDGWRDQPVAGDEVLEAPSEQRAAAVVDYRCAREQRLKASMEVETINESRKLDNERKIREKEAVAEAEAVLQNDANATRKERMEARKAAIIEVNKAMQTDPDGSHTELYFVIKADVSGSAEAVAAAIKSLPLGNLPVKVTILRCAVGTLSENDIALVAAAPEGQRFILNFGQDIAPSAFPLVEKSGVTVIDANIIYKVIDNVRERIEDCLPPIVTSRVVGEAELLQAFDIKGERRASMRVAGCRVTNGMILRSSRARVYRGGVGSEGSIVFDGKFILIYNVITANVGVKESLHHSNPTKKTSVKCAKELSAD